MKINRFLLICALASVFCSFSIADDGRVYEMRTYYANEGKLDALLTRFRDHTVDLFEKHGMTNVGYFVPANNQDNTLVYFLSYPNREARGKAWKGFMADPDWKAAYAASTKNGKLVAKVDKLFLQTTDYSPKLKIKTSKKPRFFELRTYTAAEGKLGYLDYRFKEDTIDIFANNGSGSGSERDTLRAAHVLKRFTQPHIVWPKIVAPLAETMGFINCHHLDLHIT